MKNYRKYYIECLIIHAIHFILAGFLVTYFDLAIWTILVSMVLHIPCVLLTFASANKNFISILSKERDALKFYDTVYKTPLRQSMLYRMNAEWYVGHYEKLIALSQTGYRQAKKSQSKALYLLYLARAYFDLRDFENLEKTVNEFCKLEQIDPKKARYGEAFKYYRAFLDKKFDICIFISEEQIKKNNTKTNNGKMILLTQKSNYAVACYENGDFDKAKEIFESFLDETPGLCNFKALSEKYLEAIEKKDDTVISSVIIEVDPDAAAPDFHKIKKRNIKAKILILVGIVIIITSLISHEYNEYKQEEKYQNELKQFEDEMKLAVAKSYSDFEILSHFAVYKDGKQIDCFIIIQTTEGIDLLQYVTYDGGITKDIIIAQNNILKSEAYCIEATAKGNFVGFTITDNRSSIPSDVYECISITVNNVENWFYIDYIEASPRLG